MSFQIINEFIKRGGGIRGTAIDFYAIAGRKDDRLGDTADAADLRQVMGNRLLGKSEPLPDFNRGSLMIHSKAKDGHR